MNERISEQQIDLVKEIVSRYREAEIEHMPLLPVEKADLKLQWKQWRDATSLGI